MIHELPKETLDSIKLLKFNNGKSIAYVLHTIMAAELPFEIINGVNEHLGRNPYDEVCLFSLNREMPIITASMSIFNNMELNTYYGKIVATDVPSWQASLVSPSQAKFLYIYDVKRLFNIPRELVDKINRSGFKIFTRNKVYADALVKMGFVVQSYYMEYFDHKFVEAL